jgi:hypothetical protein
VPGEVDATKRCVDAFGSQARNLRTTSTIAAMRRSRSATSAETRTEGVDRAGREDFGMVARIMPRVAPHAAQAA